MSQYDGILYVLKHDLKYWERKYKDSKNDVDAEVAENTIENISVNIGIVRKAAAFDAVLKSEKETISESHMTDDILNIIDKYKSGDPSC